MYSAPASIKYPIDVPTWNKLILPSRLTGPTLPDTPRSNELSKEIVPAVAFASPSAKFIFPLTCSNAGISISLLIRSTDAEASAFPNPTSPFAFIKVPLTCISPLSLTLAFPDNKLTSALAANGPVYS